MTSFIWFWEPGEEFHSNLWVSNSKTIADLSPGMQRKDMTVTMFKVTFPGASVWGETMVVVMVREHLALVTLALQKTNSQ